MSRIPWWVVVYVASAVVVNAIFGKLPYPANVLVGSAIVGGVYVVRDFAHRQVGSRVLWATALGVLLSYVLAAPAVAFASAVAYAAGEGCDYLVYRAVEHRSFRRRIIISSLVSVPVDTVVFLALLGGLSPLPVAMQIASKLLALVVAWRVRE